MVSGKEVSVVHVLIVLVLPLARFGAGSKLAGIIYMQRISDERAYGISVRNFKMFRKLCGDSTLRNVMIVSNMWEKVPKDVGEARERELATNFLGPVLNKDARLMRHHNTVESAHNIIRAIGGNTPIPLKIQPEVFDEAQHEHEELEEEERKLQNMLTDFEGITSRYSGGTYREEAMSRRIEELTTELEREVSPASIAASHSQRTSGFQHPQDDAPSRCLIM